MHYKSFPGQEKNVFVPKTMVGLNVRSEQRADAEAFIRMMFSGEAQENMYDGFPVNREAFAGWFAMLQGGDSNGSMLLPKRTARRRNWNFCGRMQGKNASLRSWCKTLIHPWKRKRGWTVWSVSWGQRCWRSREVWRMPWRRSRRGRRSIWRSKTAKDVRTSVKTGGIKNLEIQTDGKKNG